MEYIDEEYERILEEELAQIDYKKIEYPFPYDPVKEIPEYPGSTEFHIEKVERFFTVELSPIYHQLKHPEMRWIYTKEELAKLYERTKDMIQVGYYFRNMGRREKLFFSTWSNKPRKGSKIYHRTGIPLGIVEGTRPAVSQKKFYIKVRVYDTSYIFEFGEAVYTEPAALIH